MNALQGAMPEDVRGKVTSSVTAILQIQKIRETSSLNPKIHEKKANASELDKRGSSSAKESNEPSTENDASSEPQAHTLTTGDSVQSTSQEKS